MESNNSSNIKRTDSLRRSVRLSSARKGLAPAPPVSLDAEVELRRPSATVAAPVPVERSTILPKISLSSITQPERNAISLRIVENKQKVAVSAHDMLDEEDDANVSFALGSIEKHINQVEESFKHKQNEDSQASIDELQVELIRKSKRYCETENLLHPVGSEMASENDFQYLGGGEDLETDVNTKPQEFQRNSDVRSSMGASYTASKMAAGNIMTQRPKIARTASDTKNTDVLAMRAMIKQKQQILPQQQQQQVTTTKSQTNSGSTSVVDGNTTSNNKNTDTTTTTTKRISQRTREENLRHFEALLAANKASRNAGNANATGTRVVHVTPRSNVTPVLNTNTSNNNNNNNNKNKAIAAPLLPTTTTTGTTATSATAQQQAIKPHIISPSSAHWTPPLVIGNRNNNRLTVNNSSNNANNTNNSNSSSNNMPQVIKKRQTSKKASIIKMQLYYYYEKKKKKKTKHFHQKNIYVCIEFYDHLYFCKCNAPKFAIKSNNTNWWYVGRIAQFFI